MAARPLSTGRVGSIPTLMTKTLHKQFLLNYWKLPTVRNANI